MPNHNRLHEANDYFFGSATTGTTTTFTPQDVMEVFSDTWLEWRKADLQPLIKEDLLPTPWEIYLDGMVRFSVSSDTTVDVDFRQDEARTVWEHFLSKRCPWLSYDIGTGFPASSISIPVYRQEVRYEGELFERLFLRGIREAHFDKHLTVFPVELDEQGGLSCGDEVVIYNNGSSDEGLAVSVKTVRPRLLSFYREDGLLYVADCSQPLEVYLCRTTDRCERCVASGG